MLNMDVETVVKCAECASRNIVSDDERGEILCADCGLVIEDSIIDQGAEWVNSEGAERSRVGAPVNHLRHDKGLSTDIGWSNKDYSGRNIPSRSRSQLYRMRKWNDRARINGSRERNLEKALSEINRLATQCGLPKTVTEEAAIYYRKVLEHNLVRGRSIEAMTAACVYLANQRLKTARSLDDIVSKSNADRKQITRSFKVIKQKLKLRIEVSHPTDYLDRYCNMLSLPPSIVAECARILDMAEEYELTHGRSPTGVAAAIVYIASNTQDRFRTQREISDISGVTEVTIRNRYKELVNTLGIEMPKNGSLSQNEL